MLDRLLRFSGPLFTIIRVKSRHRVTLYMVTICISKVSKVYGYS